MMPAVMRHFILFILITLWGLSPLPLMAANVAGCPPYLPTRVNVTPIFDAVTYDFTKPMLKIRTLVQEHETSEDKSWVLGLSSNTLTFNVSTDFDMARPGNNNFTCGQIRVVNIEFGFKDNIIYVAKEFPKRSCPFKEVLAHEEKHKAVDRAILETYTGTIQSSFEKMAKSIGVLKATTPESIEAQIDNIMNETAETLSTTIKTDRAAQQKEVDSREEYERIHASCYGRTKEILDERLQLLEESYPGITKSEGRKPRRSIIP